jgi:hypothetical protein
LYYTYTDLALKRESAMVCVANIRGCMTTDTSINEPMAKNCGISSDAEKIDIVSGMRVR